LPIPIHPSSHRPTGLSPPKSLHQNLHHSESFRTQNPAESQPCNHCQTVNSSLPAAPPTCIAYALSNRLRKRNPKFRLALFVQLTQPNKALTHFMASRKKFIAWHTCECAPCSMPRIATVSRLRHACSASCPA
jgi:hypothetical protein